MIGREDHAGRAIEIRDRLARTLAEDADADFNARGAALRWQLEADRRINEWMRSPGAPIVSAADQLCQEALENHRAHEQARDDRREANKARREAQEARSAPDPSITTLHLRDAASGGLFAVSFPAAQVKRVITNSLRQG